MRGTRHLPKPIILLLGIAMMSCCLLALLPNWIHLLSSIAGVGARFEVALMLLPGSTHINEALPPTVGDFKRLSVSDDSWQPEQGSSLHASYSKTDNRRDAIDVTIFLPESALLSVPEIAQRKYLEPCRLPFKESEIYFQQNTWYVLRSCVDVGLVSYSILWRNGRYLLRLVAVSTRGSDIYDLIEFSEAFGY